MADKQFLLRVWLSRKMNIYYGSEFWKGSAAAIFGYAITTFLQVQLLLQLSVSTWLFFATDSADVQIAVVFLLAIFVDDLLISFVL